MNSNNKIKFSNDLERKTKDFNIINYDVKEILSNCEECITLDDFTEEFLWDFEKPVFSNVIHRQWWHIKKDARYYDEVRFLNVDWTLWKNHWNWWFDSLSQCYFILKNINDDEKEKTDNYNLIENIINKTNEYEYHYIINVLKCIKEKDNLVTDIDIYVEKRWKISRKEMEEKGCVKISKYIYDELKFIIEERWFIMHKSEIQIRKVLDYLSINKDERMLGFILDKCIYGYDGEFVLIEECHLTKKNPKFVYGSII